MAEGALADGDHVVPPELGRQPLDRVLRALAGGASWNAVRKSIRRGKVSIDGTTVCEPSALVEAGARLQVRQRAPRPRALSRASIVHADAQVVVVRKPPGLSTVPYEDERDSLLDRVRALLPGRSAPLGVVQRLDKETSGLLVFARSVEAKRHLQQQFRAHTVERRYLAIAAGKLRSQTIESLLARDRGDKKRGSTRHPRIGKRAVTHVRALEALSGATLCECRLETGRTHQVRIHLSEAGHPLLGERVYLRAGQRLPPAPRLMLHAAVLGFEHPKAGALLRFEEPLPEDMQEVLARLRKPRRQSPPAPPQPPGGGGGVP